MADQTKPSVEPDYAHLDEALSFMWAELREHLLLAHGRTGQTFIQDTDLVEDVRQRRRDADALHHTLHDARQNRG